MMELSKFKGRLFRKYIVLFVGVVCTTLLANGLLHIWFSYGEQKSFQTRIQREQAEAAAEKIGQFISEIKGQMAWTIDRTWTTDEIQQRYLDARRLLRQVPAIAELAIVDFSGRERLRVSRLGSDAIESGVDLANDRKFMEAVKSNVFYGPVYFRRASEPYMAISLAGNRSAGVSIAEVNLKFIRDTVSQIKVGETGQAYVVDARNRLIAHPDISLVLRNLDLSHLAPVQAARLHDKAPQSRPEIVAESIERRRVLTAYAVVKPLDWLVLVELPVDEAYAPLYASIERSAAVILGAVVLAFLAGTFLARKMTIPIQTLRAGAEKLGRGEFDKRISIRTGDELEALGDQFNRMAEQIQNSYATLDRRVDERTEQLKQANLAKSRFLATASHDLRQPLHALNLFIAQLRANLNEAERHHLINRIDIAIEAMNKLFNALLDISRLDAGVLKPDVTDFAVTRLLDRIESTFDGLAREKGLFLRIVPSGAWIRSDFVLLERVLLNLVSNAVRYTDRGGVVIGCRRRGASARIEVWDSGRGIPENQRKTIFAEFYRLPGSPRDAHGGIGLGLAIVDRLCALLTHDLELRSTVGKGSRFAVIVPASTASAQAQAVHEVPNPDPSFSIIRGKTVVVLDDDPLVREGMVALLHGWGCQVVAARSADEVLESLGEKKIRPHLIISDYHLGDGINGIEAIDKLRRGCGWLIPAFLISADLNPERMLEIREHGLLVLHKPVQPMSLRATLNRALSDRGVPVAA